jgi:hypothetical protein
MKIYEVSYIGADDCTYHSYYASKALADKKHRQLNKTLKPMSAYEEENDGIKQVFDVYSYDVEITKTGILNLLNSHFTETQ